MNVEFSTLVGEFILDGVDRDTTALLDSDEDSNIIRFRLNGVTYCALENPHDGYRSSMRSFCTSDVEIKNRFTLVRVIGALSKGEERDDEEGNLLVLTDAITGKKVLEVGTRLGDSYYPSFVDFFDPTAMSVNMRVRAEIPNEGW